MSYIIYKVVKLKKRGRKSKLIRIDPELEKKVIDLVALKKKKDKYYSFSDYVEDAIKKDMVEYAEGEERIEDLKGIEELPEDIEFEKEQKKEFNKTKITEILYGKLALVKKSVFKAERSSSIKIKKLLYVTITSQIDALLTNHEKVKNKLLQQMYSELKEIKGAIQSEDYFTLAKVCNLKEQENGYLIHLLRKKGRDDIVELLFKNSTFYS